MTTATPRTTHSKSEFIFYFRNSQLSGFSFSVDGKHLMHFQIRKGALNLFSLIKALNCKIHILIFRFVARALPGLRLGHKLTGKATIRDNNEVNTT